MLPLLLSEPASDGAPTVAADRPALVATASWNAQTWLTAAATHNRTAVELSGAVRWPSGIEAGVRARRLFSPYVAQATAWEGGAFGALSPRVGRWRPAVGVELGATGALQLDWSAREDTFFSRTEEATGVHDVVYAAVGFVPARFVFGPVQVEASSLSFGSSIPHWGRAVRFEWVALRAGVAW